MTGKARYIFAVSMALIMSFLMSGIITSLNIGIPEDFLLRWMRAWAMSFPAAAMAAILAQAPARFMTESIMGMLERRRG